MSASIRPTRWPSRASAAARFADTVDFPTPPLPLEIASTLPSPGISSGVGGAGGVAAARADGRAAACPPPSAESTTFILTAVTPGTSATALRAWRASDPGSSRVSTNVNATAPVASTATSFTIPAVTRSRPWRGFVIPLSARSTPALMDCALTLTGPPPTVAEEGACRSEYLLFHLRHRTGQRRARRAMMAAAAELMRQRRDVDLAHRPERYFDAAAADVPEQQRHANAGDRAWKLDDPVEIVRGHFVAAQCVRRHAHPGQADLGLHDQRLQHLSEQSHPAFGRAGVDRGIDGFGIDALLEQRRRHLQRAGRCVGEAKASRVGQQTDVQRLRHLRRERPAGHAREIEHELGRGSRLRRDEAGAGGQLHRTDMMIDADERGGRPSLVDHSRQAAQPAEIPDVQRCDEISTLDLTHRTVDRKSVV